MKIKYIIYALSVISLFVLQYSFVSALPGILNNLNLLLVVIVYLTVFFGKNNALLAGILWGVLLDSYAVFPYGMNMLSFFSVIIISNYLLNRFLTNLSVYSFSALTITATVFNFIIINILASLYELFFSVDLIFLGRAYFSAIFYAMILNAILSYGLFYFTNFISQRFKPVFLSNK
jgi:rod shape-determining protein MreD